MITLIHYLSLSALLFSIGIAGLIIHRHNLIHLLMSLELLLLAVNTQFIALGHYYHQHAAQSMVFFILATSAAETAVALAIVVFFFHARGTISITALNRLKG